LRKPNEKINEFIISKKLFKMIPISIEFVYDGDIDKL